MWAKRAMFAFGEGVAVLDVGDKRHIGTRHMDTGVNRRKCPKEGNPAPLIGQLQRRLKRISLKLRHLQKLQRRCAVACSSTIALISRAIGLRSSSST
jgi:hypothetical protein